MTARINFPGIRSPGLTVPQFSMSYADVVIGAAIFDLSGLPKECLTSPESHDLSWVQTIFQALGLQSLISSSLRLDGLCYTIVHGLEFQAIVVRQETCYVALLLRGGDAHLNPQFIQWAKQLQPSRLKEDLRFTSQ